MRPTARPTSPTIPTSPAVALASLVALLALAAALRIWNAGRAHLWFDEIYTLWIARLSVHDLLVKVAGDIHPPLHYLLVREWRALGGEGDVWIRSLSAVFGVATVAALVGMGRDTFGRRVGWSAAALLALHRAHIDFSAESRAFALLFLLLSIAVWLAWRWLEHGKPRDAVLYVLTAAAALYTHYLSGVVLAFLGLWGLLALLATPRRILPWVALHAAVAVLFVPQLPTLLQQTQRLHGDHWVPDPTVATATNLFRQMSLGMRVLIPVMMGFAIVPLLQPSRRRAASLLWFTSLVPVAILWALSMRGAGLFVERYMMFALPSFCLLVAAGIDAIPLRLVRLGLLVALLGLAARSTFLSEAQAEAALLGHTEGWLRAHVAPGDTVVHADAHSLLFARHYHLDPATHVLLMTTPALPYYEGELLIPSAWRLDPSRVRALAASGHAWWGVHERYGYAPAEPTADTLASIAEGGVDTLGRVIVWTGHRSALPPAR